METVPMTTSPFDANGTLSSEANEVENIVDPWAGAKTWDKTSIYIGFTTMVMLMPIGTILNLTSLIIFLKNKMWRTAVGLHLVCLAMADALECLVALFIPFWAFGRRIIPGYLYPIDRLEFMCRGMFYLRDVWWHFSSLLTVSATVERYLSLAFPLKVAGWKLHSKSKILITSYFILSFALPIYVFFTYSPRLLSPGIICTRTLGTQELFDAFNITIKRTFSTIVLGAIIFVLTCLMAKELYKQRRARKQITQTAGGNNENKSDKERQIAIMMFIIAIIFLATKIPYMIGQYTRTYGERKINVDIFIFLNDTMPVTTTITYTNFMVNFFIYYYYMSSFRKRFLQIFCCKKPEKSDGRITETSVSNISKSVDNNDKI